MGNFVRRPLIILGLFFLASLCLSAQQIPINGTTINYMAQWDAELRQLVTPIIPQIIQISRSILDDSLVLMLVLGALQHGFIAGFSISAYLWQLLIKYAFLAILLSSYNSPLPYFGTSFHQLIPQFAATIAAMIDLSSTNLLMAQLQHIQAGLASNVPSYLNVVAGFLSLCIGFDSGVLYLLSFGTSMIGFALVGFLSIIGPIGIGLALLPPLDWIFSAWLRSMFVYAFYRVANAAMIFMGVNLMLFFFNHSINGDYSVGHWFFLFPFVVFFTLLFAVLAILSFLVARDAFHGSASVGNPMLGVARFAAAVV